MERMDKGNDSDSVCFVPVMGLGYDPGLSLYSKPTCLPLESQVGGCVIHASGVYPEYLSQTNKDLVCCTQGS
jgi:hypothetical protein